MLHLAVLSGNIDSLEYLLRNFPNLSVFDRNEKGETALSIAQERKLAKAISLLERYQQNVGDKTQENTEQLLNELLEEE